MSCHVLPSCFVIMFFDDFFFFFLRRFIDKVVNFYQILQKFIETLRPASLVM